MLFAAFFHFGRGADAPSIMPGPPRHETRYACGKTRQAFGRSCRTTDPRVLLGVLLAGLVLPSGGCHQGGVGAPQGGSNIPPSQVKLARKVELAAVEQRDLNYTVETVGSLEPDRQSSIAAGVAGVVDEVLFQEGDMMDPATTVLIKIDQQKYEAALNLAKANEQRAEERVTLTRDQAVRANQLRESRAMTVEEAKQRLQELRIAQAELAAAKADRAIAEINFVKSRVRPPYSGQINDRLVAVGDYVKEETVIGTIADLSRLRLTTFVPELAATRVRPGNTLEFTLETIPKQKFTAKIIFLSTVADPQTHMFACKAEIPNPDPLMKPGMFARVQITTEQHAGAAVVPEEAIRAGEQGFRVFVPEQRPGKDGQTALVAKARRVQIGMRQPGFAEILSGVEPGEQVVTRGAEALEDGTPIEVVDGSQRSKQAANDHTAKSNL